MPNTAGSLPALRTSNTTLPGAMFAVAATHLPLSSMTGTWGGVTWGGVTSAPHWGHSRRFDRAPLTSGMPSNPGHSRRASACRKSASKPAVAASFDHLVGDGGHRWRNVEAERLRDLEMDDQLEFGRLITGKPASLAPLRILLV
jgi:hypothetical protein